MKGIDHITYNHIKKVAEIKFNDGTIKEFPMSVDEWENSIKDGKIVEIVNE